MTTFVQPPCAPLTRYVIQLLRFSILFASWRVFCAPAPGAEEPNESRHVVIVVWDGMRPDFVSEQNTPAVWKLAREGVTFRNHHAVYPSATKVTVPALSLLWLGEPDLTQHESAPGAPAALAAIKSADENFAAVLAALDQGNARGTTDVFVVSDHGFSTIERSIDLRNIFNDAGFTAKTEFTDEPKPGDIMLAGNGGCVLFYVTGHDEKIIRRLVEFLQQSDFAGVIFTKHPMEGTFSLDQAKIANDRSPDVVMSFRWKDQKNQFGVLGMIDADWQRAAGQGTHATLSPFDIHNTLIAAGPDFKRGEVDDLPSGNVDLASTILQILGIKPQKQLDGRILLEVMVNN